MLVQPKAPTVSPNVNVEAERNIKPFIDLFYRNPNLWKRSFNEEGDTAIQRFTAYDVTNKAVIEKRTTPLGDSYVGKIIVGHAFNVPYEISSVVAERLFDRLSRYNKNATEVAQSFGTKLSDADFAYTLSPDSALRQFLDILKVRSPLDWTTKAVIKNPHGIFCTYFAHDSGRTIWIRKSPSGAFSGGVNSGGVNKVGSNVEFDADEAKNQEILKILYERVKSDIKQSIANEIKHLIKYKLDDALENILGNWKFTNRIADITTGDILGYFVTAQGSFTEGRKEFRISLEAGIDINPKNRSLKISLEINDLPVKANGEKNLKNGHTGNYTFKKDSDRQSEILNKILDKICDLCNLTSFHRAKEPKKKESQRSKHYSSR